MFIGIGNPIPEIANLPGPSRPGGGGSTPAFEYTAIDNSFSMEFDGVASYYNAGTSTDLEISGNLTLSAWVYITTGSAFQGIISKRDSGGTNYQFYTDNSATPKLRFFDGSTPASSTGNVSLNAWHHIAITIDSGVTNGSTFYIDGAASGTATFTITSNDADLVIGIIDTGIKSSWFNGYMDEVAVWSSALSENTIQAIYDTTVNNPGKVADLSETPEGTPAAFGS